MKQFLAVLVVLSLTSLMLVACVPVTASPASQQAVAADPLPSWNPGPAKATILEFVADVTDIHSQSYVAPADRIAVFDNDGTLWTEKPIPAQAAFAFARVAQMAPSHPEWQTTQPYQAILQQDVAALANLSPAELEQIIFTTHAGMTEEDFEAVAQEFLATARHPRFDRPYTAMVYQPMLELLEFLQANAFRTFIVSGGGVEFMRVFSEEVYGIPRENVVGSSLQYEFQQTPEGSVLLRLPEIVSFDDKTMKPVNIQRHIGRRPIMAVGNSDGDLAMFQYTGGRSSPVDTGQVPFLNLLVVHDDAEREYDYLTNTDAVMAAAAQSPWLFVSMKNDFKTVFPTESPAAQAWQVETLLVAPGEPGRLYALMKDTSAPLWASPASRVRLMVSDDGAVTWTPFAGGLPVAENCMVNVNLDGAALPALYASTCQGLYVWDYGEKTWVARSEQRTDVVAVADGRPAVIWAAAHGGGVIRSSDGGRTWEAAGEELLTFGGMANLLIDPRTGSTLYGIIQPQYAGSYLRRGDAEGSWVTLPAPQDDSAIQTGMALDGVSGALYLTTLVPPAGLWRSDNASTADVTGVTWELVHDFGAPVQVSLLAAGREAQGPALYANIWPLTPVDGGGALIGEPVLQRSLDGGRTWEPLATP